MSLFENAFSSCSLSSELSLALRFITEMVPAISKVIWLTEWMLEMVPLVLMLLDGVNDSASGLRVCLLPLS